MPATNTNTTLRPFRDVSEHEIVNLFAMSGFVGLTGYFPKGTFVKVVSGVAPNQSLVDGGPVGGFNPPRAFSRRYAVPSQVAPCTASGDIAIGVTLFDVREVDENNVPLLFNKAKQAQLQAVLSGEAVPFATRGLFLWSGLGVATLTPGQPVYLGANSAVTGVPAGITPTATKIGQCFGVDYTNNWALLKLHLA